MDLTSIAKGSRINVGEREGTVINVFPVAGYWTPGNENDKRRQKRKPRVVVSFDDKPKMHIKIAASSLAD